MLRNRPRADRVRFELTIPSRVRRFSRPVLSTAQPPVRNSRVIYLGPGGVSTNFTPSAHREELAQQGARLGLTHAALNLGAVVESRMTQDVPHRAGHPRLLVTRT